MCFDPTPSPPCLKQMSTLEERCSADLSLICWFTTCKISPFLFLLASVHREGLKNMTSHLQHAVENLGIPCCFAYPISSPIFHNSPRSNATEPTWHTLYSMGEFQSLEVLLDKGTFAPLLWGKSTPPYWVYSYLHQLYGGIEAGKGNRILAFILPPSKLWSTLLHPDPFHAPHLPPPPVLTHQSSVGQPMRQAGHTLFCP